MAIKIKTNLRLLVTYCEWYHFYSEIFFIWDKVFKNGPSKICGRKSLKNLKGYGLLKFFKGCRPQILLGPFLNSLSHFFMSMKS